jgi:hypothetical protein
MDPFLARVSTTDLFYQYLHIHASKLNFAAVQNIGRKKKEKRRIFNL